MLANLGKLQQYAKDSQAPATGDMFGSRESKLELEITPMREWSLNDKLWMERKSLGSWITAHPLDLVKGKYEHKIQYHIRDLPDLERTRYRGVFNLAFIVCRVFQNNKTLSALIDDPTGRTEISIFRTDADPFLHALVEDTICIAQLLGRYGDHKGFMFQKVHRLGQLVAPTNLAVPE